MFGMFFINNPVQGFNGLFQHQKTLVKRLFARCKKRDAGAEAGAGAGADSATSGTHRAVSGGHKEWRHEFHVEYDDGDSKMHAPGQDEFWHLGPIVSE